jgi:hypothetical protein
MPRRLTAVEASPLWERVAATWDIHPGYWYPLGETERQDVLALEAHPFHVGGGASIVRRCLVQHGVSTCWEFREFGGDADLELTIDEFDPKYAESEGYWTASAFDWLVYASHEESITLGGAWLIDAFKAAWPNWPTDLWKCGDPAFVHRSV